MAIAGVLRATSNNPNKDILLSALGLAGLKNPDDGTQNDDRNANEEGNLVLSHESSTTQALFNRITGGGKKN
jgi:hypothetical protein